MNCVTLVVTWPLHSYGVFHIVEFQLLWLGSLFEQLKIADCALFLKILCHNRDVIVKCGMSTTIVFVKEIFIYSTRLMFYFYMHMMLIWFIIHVYHTDLQKNPFFQQNLYKWSTFFKLVRDIYLIVFNPILRRCM